MLNFLQIFLSNDFEIFTNKLFSLVKIKIQIVSYFVNLYV